jgi:hypothetical protein
MHGTHSIKITFTEFNVVWREVYFCWLEFLFFAKNFVIERQNNLEFSDKVQGNFVFILGSTPRICKTSKPAKSEGQQYNIEYKPTR